MLLPARARPVNNSLSNGERAHISRRCARTFAVVAGGRMVGHGMEGNYSAKAGPREGGEPAPAPPTTRVDAASVVGSMFEGELLLGAPRASTRCRAVGQVQVSQDLRGNRPPEIRLAGESPYALS